MHIIYTMSTQCTFFSHLLHIPDTFKTLQGMISRTPIKHAKESKEPPAASTGPERKDSKFVKRLKGKKEETMTIKPAISKNLIINAPSIAKAIQMLRETKDNLKK